MKNSTIHYNLLLHSELKKVVKMTSFYQNPLGI